MSGSMSGPMLWPITRPRRRRGAAPLLAVVAAVLAQPPVLADQYRSEARVVDDAAAATPKTSLTEQLKATTDPYARALLLRELAGEAAQRQDLDAAAKYLEQALATGALSGPAAEQMRATLGQLRVGNGDPASVIKGLGPAFKAGKPLPPGQLVALGAAYLAEKRYAEAVPPLAKGVAASPRPDLSWRRALYAAHVGAKQEGEAAKVLETIVRDQPSARDDWFRLAALYHKAGDPRRAQAVLEVASRLGYLSTAEQRLQLIGLTAEIGAPYAAAELLRRWLDGGQLPRTAANLRTQAALWIAARESALAIAALEAAIAAAPSAELYLQLGQLRLDREAYPQAIAAFRQAIALGAKSGPAYLALGIALYQQADVDAASTAFRNATQYPASRALAEQWVRYLDNGAARAQALAALASRVVREPDSTLSALPAADPAGDGSPIRLADVAPALPEAALPPVTVGSGALTAVGAEAAGSADGAIPPYSGGLSRSQWPAGFQPGQKLADPFPNDRPLATISRANLDQYRGWLSEGHRALFARYPGYTMPLYPTRRSVAFPQAVLDATAANEGRAEAPAADSLTGARLGFPFRRPKSGVEAMWNHRVRYRGDQGELRYRQAVVAADGAIRSLNDATFRVLFRYGNLRAPGDIGRENLIAYGIFSAARPGTRPEFVALFHETANSLQRARGIWVLLVNAGRMFRVPPIGYDQPFPETDAIQFIDMVDMYNGLFDRYVWKLVGKREMIIPYNSFRLSDGRYKTRDLLTRGHFNQAGTRYERHRVWVVEASLRAGNGHAFGKRVFYLDEDSWNVVMVENFDPAGALWRFQEGHLLPLYDVQAAFAVPSLTYDLKSGAYFAERLFGETGPVLAPADISEKEFLPAAVRSKYTR